MCIFRFKKIVAIVIGWCFLMTQTVAVFPRFSYAQNALELPAPGAMISLSSSYMPILLKGITIYPDNPFYLDFIVDTGDENVEGDLLKIKSEKLIKYFLASLTVPEKDLWVNLSPYEKDRIIPQEFGHTEMGRDLLSQDYILKQLTASLLYPENELGKEFWAQIRAKAQEKYGITDIPVNTFNKIWIVPNKAVVYEKDNHVFVIESHLKVMLEEDYLARKHSQDNEPSIAVATVNQLSSSMVRNLILPEIEREVNNGKNFTQLRQIYHSMILALWYKRNLKTAFLNQAYTDQNKVVGIESDDFQAKQKIYDQYLEAFKQGVYDLIKEEYDPATQEIVERKYFSGGVQSPENLKIQTVSVLPMTAVDAHGRFFRGAVQLNSAIESSSDNAMLASDLPDGNLNSLQSKIVLASLINFYEEKPVFNESFYGKTDLVASILGGFYFVSRNLEKEDKETTISRDLRDTAHGLKGGLKSLLMAAADYIDGTAVKRTRTKHKATAIYKRPIDRKQFGNNIKIIREAREPLISKAAAAMGVDYRTLGRIEKGEMDFDPDLYTILRIANYLQVSIDNLIAGDEQREVFSPYDIKQIKEQKIGKNVRFARRAAHLTWKHVVRKTGKTKGFINQIESNGVNPGFYNLLELAGIFNVRADQLLKNNIYLDGNPASVDDRAEWMNLPEEFDLSVVHERLSALQAEKGITLKEIADRTGLSYDSVFVLVRGKKVRGKKLNNVMLEKIFPIANYFQVSLYYLITGKHPQKKEFQPYDIKIVESSLANNIIKLISANGIKTLDLYKKGISHPTITKIKNGRVPMLDVVVKLAAGLKTPLDVLLGSEKDVDDYIERNLNPVSSRGEYRHIYDNNEFIGKNIAHARELAGFSLEEAAQQLKIRKESLAELEDGDLNDVDLEMVIELAVLYKTSVFRLITGRRTVKEAEGKAYVYEISEVKTYLGRNITTLNNVAEMYLAQEMKITSDELIKIKHGLQLPNLLQLIKMVNVFRVGMDDIILGREEDILEDVQGLIEELDEEGIFETKETADMVEDVIVHGLHHDTVYSALRGQGKSTEELKEAYRKGKERLRDLGIIELHPQGHVTRLTPWRFDRNQLMTLSGEDRAMLTDKARGVNTNGYQIVLQGTTSQIGVAPQIFQARFVRNDSSQGNPITLNVYPQQKVIVVGDFGEGHDVSITASLMALLDSPNFEGFKMLMNISKTTATRINANGHIVEVDKDGKRLVESEIRAPGFRRLQQAIVWSDTNDLTWGQRNELIKALENANVYIDAPVKNDEAVLADAEISENIGGIDLTTDNFELEIQRDGNGMPLPQQPSQMLDIQGLYPVIINITPVQNLPVLLGAIPYAIDDLSLRP